MGEREEINVRKKTLHKHEEAFIRYNEMGDYENALIHLKSALELEKEVLPPDSIEIAIIYGNIGITHGNLCQYGEALLYLRIALKIQEKAFPPDNLHLAITYTGMSQIYRDLGLYEDALWAVGEANEIYREALRQGVLPIDSPDIAVARNITGAIYEELNQPEDALWYHEWVLEIQEKSLPHDSLDITNTLNMIGLALGSLKRYDEALSFFWCCLKIQKKNLPLDSLITAVTYNNIGGVYQALGCHDIAVVYHMCDLEIKEKSLTQNSFDLAKSYNNIIHALYQENDTQKITEYSSKLIFSLKSLYINAMKTINETLRINHLRTLNLHLDIIHSAKCLNLSNVSESDFYDVLLKSKDIGAESDFAVRTYLPNRYPKYNDELLRLKNMRNHLSHLEMNSADIGIISKVTKEIEVVEDKLAPFIGEISFQRHMAEITTKKVLGKLPSGSALLEYGWFYFYESEAVDTSVESGGRYYAFLLHDDKIILRYLDSDDTIHKILKNIRNKFEAVEKGKKQENTKKEFAELYQLLISPFSEHLKGITHLYIAPDGDLYKLPFELLFDEGSMMLFDKFTVSYISSGRDLLRLENHRQSNQSYNSATILADPLYDLPDTMEQAMTNEDDSENHQGMISKKSHDIDKLKKFERLRFAKAESNALCKIFKGYKKECYELDAKKSTLSKIRSSSIVHISTHGFSLEKQELPYDRQTLFNKDSLLLRGQCEDPLLRCGLAFSGANTFIESKQQSKEYGDGILDAKEVLLLDLPDTNLLILSACQTALGNTNNGEGIQSLRRSFELVGARSIIATLWSVDQVSCAILMEQFFIHLLENGDNKINALIAAKKYIKNMTNLNLLKYLIDNGFTSEANKLRKMSVSASAKPYEHPYYWSGYILQGDTN